MKILICLLAMSFSLNSFSAEVKNCLIQGKKINNIIVPSNTTIKSIDLVLKSDKSRAEKEKSILANLYVEAVSIGDGKSMCDLATKKYNISQEKCEAVLTTTDTIHDLFSADFKNVSTECNIGVSAHFFFGFKM
jgi:hypothetical protein